MFDNERASRKSICLWVASYDQDRMVCARCCLQVQTRDVAAYTRTRPGDAFDPWCAACFSQLATWALAGAGDAPATDEDQADYPIVGAIFNGSD